MRFIPTKLELVKKMYGKYYQSLNGGFDDYFEDHIREADHYEIIDNDHPIGVFAVTKKNKLVCIYLEDEYKTLYEQVFEKILRFNHIEGIMTVTNDTFMLNELLRRNFRIIKGAYNFISLTDVQAPKLNYRLANIDDVPKMQELFKDFFDDYDKKVKNNDLYLGYNQNDIVSLGNIQHHVFNSNVVSIGMIVVEDQRNKGYGTDTIRAMIQEGRKRKCTVQAGCWLYNHGSKKTLMKAGLSQANMIIRVEEF